MDPNEQYRILKEEVTELSSKKQALERQIKDVKALQERKASLITEIAKLETELTELSE